MRGRRGDIHALHKGVTKVWQSADLSKAFGSVWQRLGRVVHLIKEDNGGNELVEAKRGRKWSALDEPILGDGVDADPVDASNSSQQAAAAAIIDLLEEDEDDEFDD